MNCLALVVLTPLLGTCEPDEQSLISRLLTALKIREESIHNYRWSGTFTSAEPPPAADPPSVVRFSGMTDDCGRFDLSWALTDEDVTRMVYDGQLVWGISNTGQTCVANDYQCDHLGWHPPDVLWGTVVDRRHVVPLSTLLQGAHTIALKPGVDGFAEIVADVDAWILNASVHVTLDPAAGMLPRTIQVRDYLLQIPYYTWRVQSAVDHDGVWLPTKATLVDGYVNWTKPQLEAFGDALARRTLGTAPTKSMDPEQQRLHREAIAEIFGAQGVPVRSSLAPRSFDLEYQSLNRPYPAAAIRWQVPDDHHAFNGVTDESRPAGSRTWLPHREPADAPAPSVPNSPEAPAIDIQIAGPLLRGEWSIGANVGTLSVGATAVRRAEFTNTSPHPVTLKVTRKSCPCITAEIQPSIVPPGGQGRIAIGVPVVEASGPQEYTAIITASSAEAEQSIPAHIAFKPDIDLMVRPHYIATVLEPLNDAEVAVFVRRPDGVRLKSVTLVSSNGTLEPQYDRQTTHGTAIRIPLKPTSLTPGIYRDTLTLTCEGMQLKPLSTVVRILPWVRASPAGLAVLPNESHDRSITLHSLSGGGTLKAELAPELSPHARLTVIAAAPGQWKLAISLLSPIDQIPTHIRDAITLSDDESGLSCSLPLVRFSAAEIEGLKQPPLKAE